MGGGERPEDGRKPQWKISSRGQKACLAITISPSRRKGERGWGGKLWRNFAEQWTRAMISAPTFRRSTLATYPLRKRERGSIATSSPIHFHAKTFPKPGNWLEWKRGAAQGRDCFGRSKGFSGSLRKPKAGPMCS